jgi:hypothetical protein
MEYNISMLNLHSELFKFNGVTNSMEQYSYKFNRAVCQYTYSGYLQANCGFLSSNCATRAGGYDLQMSESDLHDSGRRL